MRPLRRPTSNGEDESGSVIMAVTIAMVISMLLAVTVSTVMSSQTTTRIDQNRTNAFQHANAGIDQALYRIDSGTATADFTDTFTSSGSTYAVTATMVTPGQNATWRVRSVGTDASGQARAAIATIAADPLFLNGFFTLDTFYLTGNQTSPIAYRSSLCPDASCSVSPPVPAMLGTNSTFDGSAATTAHFLQNWQGFNMYGKATQAEANAACDDGRCSSLGGLVVPHTDKFVPAIPSSDGAAGCPSGGNITGVIQPGRYLCNQPVNMTGTVTVGSGGDGSGIVRLWINESFSVGAGAQVNPSKPPWKMQVYQPAKADGSPDGTQWSGTVCDSKIWALLYTPGLRIDCNGSHQPEFWGAVVAHLHGGTGNHFQFHMDLDSVAREHNGKYVLKDWRECPVGVLDC
ncbi:MAG: hypothetical protein AVDCRST_MAG50-1233 [uncultured Acidimicrobiales bacterium]|uniref:DUF7305 domain-containing protein n=1 Tax=uncultured Acidimicrobiales bacterium TaxID=310071 RepID=A0A6J4HVY6_9ACTN|nr:MAG: hypothetical protein AVDCRST_MAG50-1233 [uncultured Acidimicrobiales bacterium]